MSLPPALIDQLLTGYLDEVLSADELARVETLLQTEPSVAEELAKLQELRTALKAVALSDSDIRLDAGFAGRVIDEAVLRARAEGASDDHPLLRLEDPTTSTSVSTSTSAHTSSTWRVAAVMVGLAASIAIAVISLRSQEDRENGGPDPSIVQVKPEIPVRVPPQDAVLQPAPENSIASNQRTNPPVDPVSSSPTVPILTEDLVQTPSSSDVDSVVAMPDSDSKGNDSSAGVVALEPQQPAAALRAIVVLNVELTDKGREREAFKAAMNRAGLKLSIAKKISDEVVGIDEETSPSEMDEASVVYLQASAKALDRLCLGLIADREGVKSVGMGITMDAPVVRTINAVRQDPTRVQHDSSSLELLSDDDSLAQLTQTLREIEYIGMGNRQAILSSGGDETAEILLLVK